MPCLERFVRSGTSPDRSLLESSTIQVFCSVGCYRHLPFMSYLSRLDAIPVQFLHEEIDPTKVYYK